MKILAIILSILAVFNSFIFYCALVVGKRADERARALKPDRNNEE